MPKPLRVRYKYIERKVTDLLDKHNVHDHPIEIEKIAEAEGFKISYEDLDDELSGFLLKEKNCFIIGVNSANSRERQRFTIAHECGHALLHDFDDVHVDQAFKLRSPLSSKAVDIEEIEANTFAAAILMPEEMLLNDIERQNIDIQDDEKIKDLAEEYEVSQLSMTFRITNLLSLKVSTP